MPWMAFATDSGSTVANLNHNSRMSDCENRWVALYHKTEDKDYTYGFVYIDPEAGFTFHISGSFALDAEGRYHPVQNPLVSDKINVKIRLDGNGARSTAAS